MKKVSIYLGHAINGAPQEFLDEMESLKKLLKNHPRIEFIEYIGLDPKADDTQVFIHDEKNTIECQLFVAVATVDSTGLGIEIGIANNCHKPTLLFFHVGVPRKSRMTTGSCVRNPNMKILDYVTVHGLFEQVVMQVEIMLA